MRSPGLPGIKDVQHGEPRHDRARGDTLQPGSVQAGSVQAWCGRSIGQRRLDGAQLGGGVWVALKELTGLAVPVARVRLVALDLVEHSVDPARGGAVFVRLDDGVSGVPVPGQREVAGLGQIGTRD